MSLAPAVSIDVESKNLLRLTSITSHKIQKSESEQALQRANLKPNSSDSVSLPLHESAKIRFKRRRSTLKKTIEKIDKRTIVLASAFLLTIIAPIVAAIYMTICIFIGVIFWNKCPVNGHRIPIWIVIFGFHGFVLAMFRNVFNFRAYYLKRPSSFEITPLELIFVGAGVGAVWFFTGNYWIYTISNIVLHDDPTLVIYCHKGFYVFAWWNIVVVWVLSLTIIIHILYTIFKPKSKHFVVKGTVSNEDKHVKLQQLNSITTQVSFELDASSFATRLQAVHFDEPSSDSDSTSYYSLSSGSSTDIWLKT